MEKIGTPILSLSSFETLDKPQVNQKNPDSDFRDFS